MASGALPTTFNGLACPLEINFGYVHGPSAAVAHIKLAGLVLPPPGTPGSFFIGASTFNGFVTNREYDPIEDETSIRLVDWRDRLHDLHMKSAFNMQESDGRYYHILPPDWITQTKTYVTRELEQFNFMDYQNLPAANVFNPTIARNNLFSAFSLLNWIGQQLNIRMTADPFIYPLLQQSYPINLDFNSGSVTVGNAIQSIVQKCGMQFTCFGWNNMHFTLRGMPSSTFSEALSDGFLNLCSLGVSSGKIGDELNEAGRRVVILGDRNKYEYIFICRQNWNPAWTWGMVFAGYDLDALLGKLGLDMKNKVGDMPEAYRDYETYAEADAAGEGELPARKTRNLMTIREYLEKIAFKAYVIESRAVANITPTIEDAFVGNYFRFNPFTFEVGANLGGFNNFPRHTHWDDPACNFQFPLSKNLITDSNLQFLVYAITRNITRGKDSPVAVQHTFVPRSQGVSLDVEEVVNPSSGRAEYRIRVFFNNPQVFLPPGARPDDPSLYLPDLVAVRLCLEGDQFMYTQGEAGQNIRVREQVATVRNLYRAFLNGREQTVLSMNFLRDLERGGQVVTATGVRAEQIAQRIATQLLWHEAITRSGSYTFDDRAGFVPDGIIDSVTVSYSAMEGATETVNFTSGFNNDRDINSPIPVKISRPFRNEEELALDRLRMFRAEAMKDKGLAGKALALMDTGLHEPGALEGLPMEALAYSKGGVATVEIGATVGGTIGVWYGGTVLVLGKPPI